MVQRPQLRNADIAIRVVARLTELTARFETLLSRLTYLLKDSERPIADSIAGQLVRIKQSIYDATTAVRIAAASADDDELAHTVGDNRLIIEDIATQHRRLRHLPIPQPSREAFIFFESAWRAAFPQTDAKPPSLCTSDQLDPSEHALSDITVVDQAKLDYASPLAWPALLHEIGHAVIRELRLPGVSNTAQQRNVQNSWLLELGCDYVATLIAGPSFLCDFTWRALMDPAFTDSTERHPAPAVRLSVLQRFSARWLRQDPLFEQVSSLVQSKRQCTESELSHIKGHVSDS